MSIHIAKVIEATFIAPNVKRFVVHKPNGYAYVPGQATMVAINEPGWDDKFRAFTFTSLTRWEHLEFMVKIYPDRKGVTEHLTRIHAGSELILQEPFGAIQYKGPGVFIAGGSGITPFLAILRELKRNNQVSSNKLIYSNYTSRDVICGAELHDILKDNYINHYTRENVIGYLERRLNKEILMDYINDFSQRFYVCGSKGFVETVTKALMELGVKADALIIDG